MRAAGLALFDLLGRVAIAANAIGTLLIVGLVAVLNYDVVARGVFSAPFHGAVEVVQFSMVLIVFLQLPDVCRAGRLTRSDGLLLMLEGGARRRLAGALRRVVDGVSCVLMLLIAIAMWPEFTEAWETDDFFGIAGVFTAPWWPVKLTIFASATLCTALFALKALLGGRVGEPLVEAEAEPR